MAKTTKADAGFEILHKNILLKSWVDSGSGRTHEIEGAVSRLHDGRLMARALYHDSVQYGPWDPVAKQADLSSPISWGKEVMQRIERANLTGGVKTLGPPPESELDRFAQAWPQVAARIGFTAWKEPVGLFPASVNTLMFPKSTSADVRPWFDLHISGDYGTYGKFDPTPLTDEEWWALGIQTQARRSDAAIQSGRGDVVSRFEHGESPWVRHFTIVTTLSSRGSQSFAWNE